jgi:hypothetical protein
MRGGAFYHTAILDSRFMILDFWQRPPNGKSLNHESKIKNQE